MATNGHSAPHANAREELRQAAVFASGVLAMRGNAALQAVVQRTATLLETPIAAVSISDRERQWFPVSIGLPHADTPRAASFCSEAVAAPETLMCVPDAAADPRFRDSPLVTGALHIRFYAATAILTQNGIPLGALCAMDKVPRTRLTPQQQAGLQALAAEATQEIGRIDNAWRYGADGIDNILQQIRRAAQQGDETLIVALDKVLQELEARLDPRRRR